MISVKSCQKIRSMIVMMNISGFLLGLVILYATINDSWNLDFTADGTAQAGGPLLGENSDSIVEPRKTRGF